MTTGAGVRKRSVTIAGHRTSLSLEDAFWNALQEIANPETVLLAIETVRITP